MTLRLYLLSIIAILAGITGIILTFYITEQNQHNIPTIKKSVSQKRKKTRTIIFDTRKLDDLFESDIKEYRPDIVEKASRFYRKILSNHPLTTTALIHLGNFFTQQHNYDITYKKIRTIKTRYLSAFLVAEKTVL